MKNKVYLGLGSNVGDRLGYLKSAVDLLRGNKHIEVVSISSVYETAPVGNTSQDFFLNLALSITTELTPEDLLTVLQKIEQSLDRVRELRWGPRTIDIDILLYNDLKINTEKLVVPHEKLFERAFALVPLKEIYTGQTNYDFDIHIKISADKNTVKLYTASLF